MADVQILEELLSRYNFSGEVDAKEFLDKLLFEGDSSYITEFRSAFKDNFFIPVSKQFEKLYNNIKKKLESFDDEKLEKVTDPFGLSELSKKHESEIKDYENRMLEFLKKDFTTNQNVPNFSALENTDVGKIIEEPTKKIKETENEKNVGEQKGFLPTENIISFSEKTKVFLKDLLYGFGDQIVKKLPKVVTPEQKDDSKSSVNLLSKLILGLLADAILMSKKLGSAFEYIFGLPAKLLNVLKSEGLYKFADYKAWLDLRIEKYITNPLKNIKGFENFSKNVSDWGENLWKNFKRVTKFDDIYAWISLEIEKYIINPFKSVGNFFKNIGDNVANLFSAEGKLSGISKVLKSIQESGSNFIKWIESFDGIIGTITKTIGNFSPILSGLLKFLVEKFPIIDGIINAIKTTTDLLSDTSLSPLQKGISILSSFIGGISDFIFSIIELIGKGISGITGLLTGKGFFASLDNSFSKWIDNTFRAGGRGTGVQVGQEVSDLMRASNTGNGFFKDLLIGTKETLGIGNNNAIPTNEEIQKNKKQPQNFKNQILQDQTPLTLEQSNPVNDFVYVQDAVIDSTSIRGKDGKTYIPSSEDTVIASKPDGALNKSIVELKQVMISVRNEIKKLKNIDSLQAGNSNFSTVNIAGGGGGGGDSFATSTRDPIFNARLEWWKMNPVNRGVI